ncbi:MAG: Trp biosynthesis-associated membrane protein [Actinomycetota bacterium]
MAGLLSLVAGGGWPVMGRRYDAPARRTDAPGLWEALDQGEDPTDRPG